jgi:hypothetical protein
MPEQSGILNSSIPELDLTHPNIAMTEIELADVCKNGWGGGGGEVVYSYTESKAHTDSRIFH